MSIGGGQSSSKQSSDNQAYPWLKDTYSPQINTGVAANQGVANLLGVGGDPSAQNAAFQNYLGSSGYNFQMQQGQNAITSSNAASGLLNSGSALKGLAKYGQGLGSNYFQQYLQNLGSLSSSGLQAGGLVGQTGQRSSGKSSSWNASVGL